MDFALIGFYFDLWVAAVVNKSQIKSNKNEKQNSHLTFSGAIEKLEIQCAQHLDAPWLLHSNTNNHSRKNNLFFFL